jgi:hypothetical protein
MIKISTLYKKNPKNLRLVINEINPENEWVFTDSNVKATRKFDGTAAAIIDGVLYKRYDVKKGREVPKGAIPCQEPDAITGHWPHWVITKRSNPEDKYFSEAFDLQDDWDDGTYELCGPKVQGNVEHFEKHTLVKHGDYDLFLALNIKKPGGEYLYDFNTFRQLFEKEDIEGIVFYHPDGRMCKIRKSDFGIKR